MKPWWFLILRIILGGAFIWAGAIKAWDPAAFAQSVEGYRLLPHAATVAVALYLPWLEILCGATLIIGRLRSGSILILSVLLLIFLAALISAWCRGLDINCGCFTISLEPSGYLWPVMRDLLLLVGLVLLIIFKDTIPDKSRGVSR